MKKQRIAAEELHVVEGSSGKQAAANAQHQPIKGVYHMAPYGKRAFKAKKPRSEAWRVSSVFGEAAAATSRKAK